MGEANSIPVDIDIGDIIDCVVEQIMPYGVFVRLTGSGRKGMIHISELSYNFVKDINEILSLQDKIKAKVIKIDEKGRIDLSIKQLEERHPVIKRTPPAQRDRDDSDSFEKKIASYLKTSEAKITDLNTRNSARSGRGRRNPRNRD